MANPWFRMYSEFADDPKVQSMPEAMQRRFVMLLCMKCKGVTFQERFVTFHWRVTPTELAETKALFIEHGFIDEYWNLLNWDKRQFISDSSTDRTRRYRERLETSRERHSDGDATKCDALDTDTDSDTQKKRTSSRAKREAKKADPRHASFKEATQEYWQSKNPIDMTWDGSEAKALSRLLQANPKLELEGFRNLLRNRYRSDVNHAERPRQWLEKATNYAGGPLNEFRNPKGATADGNSGTTADRKIESVYASTKAALERIDGMDFSEDRGARRLTG